jgi:hypothetical protein
VQYQVAFKPQNYMGLFDENKQDKWLEKNDIK